MPSPRSDKAPRFPGRDGEPFTYFLREFEALATSHSLSDAERVEAILLYTTPRLGDFWRRLTSYSTRDWRAFHKNLERLYPDTQAATRYTKQGLRSFVDSCARKRI